MIVKQRQSNIRRALLLQSPVCFHKSTITGSFRNNIVSLLFQEMTWHFNLETN